MKPFYSSFLALLAASSGAFATTTASTTPVGYVTVSVAGNPTANPSGSVTFVAPTLVQPTVYADTASASPAGTTSVSLTTGTAPTTLDGTYVLELTSGTNAGWWSTVVSSTAGAITVTDNFPAGTASGDGVAVRLHNTVQSLFGANSLSLQDYNGIANPDYVLILDPVAQAVDSLIYVYTSSGLGLTDGWYDFVTGNPAGSDIITPGTSPEILRNGSTGLTAVVSGTVKTTPSMVDIYPGDNWIAQTLAAGSTLGAMNFANQMIQYDGVRANDYVEVINADQSVTSYASADPSLDSGLTMFDFVQGTDATGINLASGTGFDFARDHGQAGSVVTFPAQTVSN